MTSPQTFFVAGVPIPKGSKRGYARGKRVVIVDDNKKAAPWQQTIRVVAGQQGLDVIQGPAAVRLVFWMPAPKRIPAERNGRPAVYPDVDKLTRVVLDALTGVAWGDDGQVVSLTAEKRYAVGGDLPAGVMITVAAIGPEALQLFKKGKI